MQCPPFVLATVYYAFCVLSAYFLLFYHNVLSGQPPRLAFFCVLTPRKESTWRDKFTIQKPSACGCLPQTARSSTSSVLPPGARPGRCCACWCDRPRRPSYPSSRSATRAQTHKRPRVVPEASVDHVAALPHAARKAHLMSQGNTPSSQNLPQLAPEHCLRCEADVPPTVCPGTGPHYARLNCGHCGAFLRWLRKPRADRLAVHP